MSKTNKLEKLRCSFPRLTEANQQFILGYAEGLKNAQGYTLPPGKRETVSSIRKTEKK
jgi:hypothetical protein